MGFENRNITIHIGMPKCASSTLQHNFFLRLPFINYAGIGSDKSVAKSIFRITHQDDAYFNMEEVRNQLINNFENKFPTIISSEMACGPMLPLSRQIPQNRMVIAKRLHSIFPEANILIIIRNQFTIHKSIYAQLLKSEISNFSTGGLNFKEWINLNINLYRQGIENIFSFADYKTLYNIYKPLFKNIKIVLFEDMIQDLEYYLRDEICPYSGIDAERALPFFKNKVERKRYTKNEDRISRISIFMQNYLGNPQKLILAEKRKVLRKMMIKASENMPFGKIKTEFTKLQIDFLIDLYSKGNKEIAEHTKLDMRKFGYPM